MTPEQARLRAFCLSCGAHIRWCLTETGKRIPVDWLPDDRGQLVLYQDSGGRWHAVHEANAEPEMKASPARFVAHFATCDAPERFRKPRPSADTGEGVRTRASTPSEAA